MSSFFTPPDSVLVLSPPLFWRSPPSRDARLCAPANQRVEMPRIVTAFPTPPQLGRQRRNGSCTCGTQPGFLVLKSFLGVACLFTLNTGINKQAHTEAYITREPIAAVFTQRARCPVILFLISSLTAMTYAFVLIAALMLVVFTILCGCNTPSTAPVLVYV